MTDKQRDVLIGIDAGTSVIKAVAFDLHQGKIIASSSTIPAPSIRWATPTISNMTTCQPPRMVWKMPRPA